VTGSGKLSRFSPPGATRRTLLLSGAAFVATLAIARQESAKRVPVLGGPCEGCELVFEGMPEKFLSIARIAPSDEPGEPLAIAGVVRTQKGTPAAGIIVYAYHTNSQGIYPRAATRHGALRGWAISDAFGNYRFDTIRPAAYPGREIPQHVHMHVIEPGKGTYYIDELRFEDDPLITAANRSSAERGGKGLAMPIRRGPGWFAGRDIVLGLNVPGYL